MAMMSMSVSGGAHNARHNVDPNYRAKLPNVDPGLTKHNVVMLDETIEDTYQQLFGSAVAAHDEAQRAKRHPERCYGSTNAYLRKVTEAHAAAQERAAAGKPKSANVPAPVMEYVLQVGNRDTWRELGVAEHIAILQETAEAIRERTGSAIQWFQIAIHVDETDGTPHLHMAGVPYATGCKRGLETQVSLSGALRELGLKRKPELQELLMRELEAVAEAHGVTRDVRDEHRPHLDVPAYRQVMREVERESDRLERLRQGEEQERPAVVRAQAEQRAGATHLRDLEAEQRELEQRNRELGARKAELEREVRELRSEVRDSDLRVSGVLADLGRARDAVAEALRAAVERFGRLWGVSSTLAHIAGKLGLREAVSTEKRGAMPAPGGVTWDSEPAKRHVYGLER